MKNGFHSEDFRIYSRIKRHYSVYLKMQRKGITIEEVLDLLAIRVVIKDSLDCYKVLGLIHLNFKPIISRFKDYIALPKENGYQTIHTTVFHEASIYEIQIRTTGMHNSAEYGVAAHWKYKSDGIAPNLDWLSNLQFKSTNIEEFYELVKNDLYSEDISVFSPDGDLYTLPNGATALDFGYAIHTDIGNMAKEAYINNIKSSLLTVLKNGDIVRISLSKEIIPRCSWYDAVKTSKAKNAIKLNCIHRMKTIDKESSINILATIFDKSIEEIDHWVKSVKLSNNIHKASRDLNFLREVKNRLKNSYRKDAGFLTKIKIRILKLKSYKFDNIIVSSNTPISSIVFDYCCHPKMGDDIIAFKSGNKAFVHHKMCDIGYEQMVEGTPMLFVEWEKESMVKYNLVVSLDNKKGSLAIFLHFMAKNDINVLKIELGNEKDGYASYCKLNIETVNKDIKILKSLITQKAKVIEMYYEKDAYGGIG